MLEANTSPAPARFATRDAMWTVRPLASFSRRSNSPACTPARTAMPMSAAERTIAWAQRTARAGPSKDARKPSPVVASSAAAEPLDVAADEDPVLVEQGVPALVAQVRRRPRGIHDVREQQRGQDAVRLGTGAGPGHELLDLVDDRVAVAGEREVVVAVELVEGRARDERGDLAPEFDRDDGIAPPVEQTSGRRSWAGCPPRPSGATGGRSDPSSPAGPPTGSSGRPTR